MDRVYRIPSFVYPALHPHVSLGCLCAIR
jgi:hypothetical protein